MTRWLLSARPPGLSNLGLRIGLVSGIWLAYALIFESVRTATGNLAADLVVLPAAAGGLLLGLRAGFVFGLVAFPVSRLVFAFGADSTWNAVAFGNWANNLIGLALGAGVGWLSDLLHELRAQTRELAVEQQSLENKIAARKESERLLRRTQHELELRVQDRSAELERVNAQLERIVSDYQRTEAELAVLGHRYEAITNSMGEGILGLDREGRAIFVNPAGAKMLGWEASALIGQPINALVQLGLPIQEADSNIKDCSDGISPLVSEHDATTGRYYRRDGSFFHAKTMTSSLRNDHGERVGTVVVFEDVSTQQRAQQELASEKERLAITLSSIGDGVITTDTAGKILILNPHAERLTGWNLADAVGRDLMDVFTLVNTKTHAASENPVARVLASGQTIGLSENTAMVARDGAERFVSSSIAPIRNWAGDITGVVLVFRDITRLKQAEEELRASREYARNLIDSSLDMIIAVDSDRRITEFNKAAQRTFGYTPEEVLGKNVGMLYAASEGGQEVHAETEKRGVCRQEVLNRRKDGRVFPCFLSASVVRDGNGQPVGIMGVSRDITERKLAEQQNIRAAGLAALGRLAAALAHEINNPLQTIQGMLELVLDFPLTDDEREKNLRIVRQEIERLADVTGRVLQFARPAKGPRHLVSIPNLVEQTLMLAGKQLQHANIQTSVDLQEIPPVPAAPEQLAQVFLNLLLNAIEAIDQDGHIRITTRRKDRGAIISFIDDGPPIDPEAMTHIFEPFFTTKENGSGLGLWVSQGIIHQHGGDITFRNLDGARGVEFVVQLPIAQAARSEETAC